MNRMIYDEAKEVEAIDRVEGEIFRHKHKGGGKTVVNKALNPQISLFHMLIRQQFFSGSL